MRYMPWSLSSDTLIILGIVVLFVFYAHRHWYRALKQPISLVALTVLLLVQIGVIIYGSRIIVANILPLIVEPKTPSYRVGTFVILLATLLLTLRLGERLKFVLFDREVAHRQSS